MDRETKSRKAFTLVELIAVIAVMGVLAVIAIPKYADYQNRSRVKSDGTLAMEIIRLAKVAEGATKSKSLTIVDSYVKKSFTNNVYPPPQSGGKFVLSRSNNAWTVSWTPVNSPGYNTQQIISEGYEKSWAPRRE
ncbi:MAG: type II secretion system GspH family protein [Clostridia bacterium]|nr:type II secretion system GspH family protein [Clostridia bacterium]